jgi:TIMELESS-interacting protein
MQNKSLKESACVCFEDRVPSRAVVRATTIMYQGDEDDELQRLLEGRDEEDVPSHSKTKSPARKKQRVDDDIIPEREDYGNMDDFIIRHPEDEVDSDDENREPAGDEAIEAPAKKKTVRRVALNPQPKLDPDRLKSAKGLVSLLDEHSKLTLRGAGHEADDLNRIMFVLEHWGHRLFPKMAFDDFIERLEQLGSKKAVSVMVKKMRQGQTLEAPPEFIDDEDEDDDIQRGFDLMAEPEATPVTAEQAFDSIFSNERGDSPQPAKESVTLTEEQRQVIARKRLEAIERRREREAREALDQNAAENISQTDQPQPQSPDQDSAEQRGDDLLSQQELMDMLADAEME